MNPTVSEKTVPPPGESSLLVVESSVANSLSALYASEPQMLFRSVLLPELV